jgi:hypothetical protein
MSFPFDLHSTAVSDSHHIFMNQTRPHCVNQMGKTHSKPLAARHGRGTAWARHAMCESALRRPLYRHSRFLQTGTGIKQQHLLNNVNMAPLQTFHYGLHFPRNFTMRMAAPFWRKRRLYLRTRILLSWWNINYKCIPSAITLGNIVHYV